MMSPLEYLVAFSKFTVIQIKIYNIDHINKQKRTHIFTNVKKHTIPHIQSIEIISSTKVFQYELSATAKEFKKLKCTLE